MKRAFTLIELLVALSLMAVFLPAFFCSTIRAAGSAKILAGRCRRQQVVCIIGERICRDIRGASEVLPQSGTEEVFLRCGSEETAYRLYSGMVRRRSGGISAYLCESGDAAYLSFTYPSSEEVTVALNDEVYYVGKRMP